MFIAAHMTRFLVILLTAFLIFGIDADIGNVFGKILILIIIFVPSLLARRETQRPVKAIHVNTGILLISSILAAIPLVLGIESLWTTNILMLNSVIYLITAVYSLWMGVAGMISKQH